MSLRITAIDQADYAALASMLRDNNLLAGNLEAPDTHFFGFSDDSGWRVGVGGLEVHGQAAILRGFITVACHRGQGLGGTMLEELVARARALGVTELFLFTTDAKAFFARHGFVVLPRENAPFAITASPEFAQHCASATFMHRQIG